MLECPNAILVISAMHFLFCMEETLSLIRKAPCGVHDWMYRARLDIHLGSGSETSVSMDGYQGYLETIPWEHMDAIARSRSKFVLYR